MPGTCLYSAETNRKWYQKFFDSLQINNRAIFDKAVRDGWYGNAIALSMKLKTWDGHKIMWDFERVALDFIRTPKEQTALKQYVSYYTQWDAFWQVLRDYRKKFKKVEAFAPTELEKIIKKLPADEQAQLIWQRALLKKAYQNKVTRWSFAWELADLADEDKAAINRFINYAKEQQVIEPFMRFFDIAKDKPRFISKTMVNDVYFGFLKQINDAGLVDEIVTKLWGESNSTPDLIVREYAQWLLEKTFPEVKEKMLDPTDAVELRKAYEPLYDKFLLTPADKQVQDWLTMRFLKAAMMESRILSSMSKFSLGWVSWALMLGQNFFTNFIQFKWITKWMPQELRQHKLVDFLVNSGVLSATTSYEDYRKLIVGSGKETLTEKLYQSTIHKWAYWVANQMPGTKLKKGVEKLADVAKDASLTGLHNIQDHIMAWPHLRAGITQAALEVFWDNPKYWDKAFDAMQKWTLPEEVLNKFIVRAQELGQSGNNAFSFEMLQKHMLSNWPWSVISYLQWYHMQRIWEMTAGFKKLADAVAGWEVSIKDWNSVRTHLWEVNPELRKFLMINLDTAHLGFFIDHFYDDEDNNNPKDYAKLYNEYANSLWASFFGRMASNLMWGFQAVEVYEDATGKKIPMIQWVPVAILDFVNSLFPMMYREFDVYKLIPRMMDAIKVSDPAMFVALRKEALDAAFNGNYRFNMPEWENTFWQISLPEKDDIIGSLLLWMHTTNKSIALSDKLYEVGKIDKIIQGKDENEVEDSWLYKTWKALPFIDTYYAWDISKTAEWKALKAVKENDPVLKALYAWDSDLFWKYISQYEQGSEIYTTEVKEFFKDLTSFNYREWNKTDATRTRKEDFYSSDKFDSIAKEELFTSLLEESIWKEILADIDTLAGSDAFKLWKEAFADAQMSVPSMEEAGFQKILINAEKSTPGSAKVVVAYLANKLWYDWARENAPEWMKWYPDIGKADLDPASIEKKREILERFFPYVYIADKTSYLKVAQNQLKNQYPEVFKGISSSQKSLINTLTLADFVAHREVLSGEPSAGNIASVLNLWSKYIKDDIDKLAVMNYTVRWIEQLDVPREDKDMAIQWVFYSGVETLHNVVKNKEIMESHGEHVTEAIDNLFWSVDRIAVNGWNIHALTNKDFEGALEKEDLMNTLMDDYRDARKSSPAGKTAYQAYARKPYVQRPYNTTNASIQGKVAAAANKDWYEGLRQYYTPSPNGYATRNANYTARSMSGSPSSNYSVPRPKILDSYFRLARSEWVASITSPALLKQTVKRSLESESGAYRQPGSTWYKRQIMPAQRSVKPIRTAAIKKRWPNVQLPLWLINIW